MLTAIVAIMCFWAFCWTIGFTCEICDRDTWANNWYAAGSIIAFAAIWIAVGVASLPETGQKTAPAEKEIVK